MIIGVAKWFCASNSYMVCGSLGGSFRMGGGRGMGTHKLGGSMQAGAKIL